MHGLFAVQDGANIIKWLCGPLHTILTPHSIGRFLQFFHLFGYLAAIFLVLFYPESHQSILIGFAVVLGMFIAFNGCILTRAEMDFLGKKETTPGLVLDLLNLRPTDKDIDRFVQKAGSVAAILAPIIFILWSGRWCERGLKSDHTINVSICSSII